MGTRCLDLSVSYHPGGTGRVRAEIGELAVLVHRRLELQHQPALRYLFV